MTETIVLDPTAVSGVRTQLDITSWVKADGVNWGDAAITAYMADAQIGSLPVDYRIPNRVIQIPLVLKNVGGTTFAAIRTSLQKKIGLFHREGGWIMRQVGATPLYADVVDATLHLGGSWMQAYQSADIDATLQLQCRPDWYGDEVTLGNHSETTNAQLVFTETGITGNYPGRMRLIVSNDSANDQHSLLFGIRCRNYSSAATAGLVYEGEGRTALDAAATFSHSGASGGSTMRHNSLPSGVWCPVLSTGNLNHTGSYRVWARVYSATATPRVKFLWAVGDPATMTENPPAVLPAAGGFYVLDLGSVRLDPAPAGTHQWSGIVQAQAANPSDPIEIDVLWLQPLDEGAGKLVSLKQPSPLTINTVRGAGGGSDDSGVGTRAWSSPTWITVPDGNSAYATQSGAGSSTSHYLKTGSHGFTVPTGSTILGIQADVTRGQNVTYWQPGYAVVDNRVRLVKAGTVQAGERADTVTPWPNSYGIKTYGGSTDLWGGSWTAADINSSGFGLAISGVITNGGYGFDSYAYVDYVQITVFYMTTGSVSTTPDAVLYATQGAEIRTEGMYREDPTGVTFGPVQRVTGDLPRIPPSYVGLEGRTVQMFVKASRGDLDAQADAGIDDISAYVTYRPSYLFTP